MKKTVIALRGTENSGKTKTLKKLRDMFLIQEGALKTIPSFDVGNKEGDFISFMNFQKVSICIISQGDGPIFMEEPLKKAVEAKCGIIICACRSYGQTQDIIREVCSKYKKVWVTKNKLNSDLGFEDELRDIANVDAAEFILKVTKKIIGEN